MSKKPVLPPESIFHIDLNPLRPLLIDLPGNAIRGMRHEREGWAAVVQEVVDNQAEYGDRAGITTTDFNQFVQANADFDTIVAHIPQLEKALEVAKESAAHKDNLRQRLAASFAKSAEDHAGNEGGDTTLLTRYEKTCAYRSAVGEKSANTRRKNEEQRAEEESDETDEITTEATKTSGATAAGAAPATTASGTGNAGTKLPGDTTR